MLEVAGDDGGRWQITAGSDGHGFLEARTYTFRVASTDVRLFIDDVELSLRDGRFTWKVGFYAGGVDAELVNGAGQMLANYRLDIGPAPDKLGQPLFEAMVDDLLRFRPGLLLGREAERDAFDPDASAAPHEVQYARLRRHAFACCQALQAICAHPLTRLREDRRLYPIHLVRRLDTRAALQVARSPLASTIAGIPDDTACKNLTINAPFTQATLDNDANRAMAWMLHRMLHRAGELVDWLEYIARQQDDDGSTRKCPRRLEWLNDLRHRLRGIARRPPFCDVTETAISSAGLTAISAHPAYARAYQLAWRALQTGITDHRAAEALPISPTWQVYERWCFLCVTRILQDLYPDASWQESNWGGNADQIKLTAQVGDMDLTAWLQPTFVAWDQTSALGQKSLSRQRIPDIVVTIDSPPQTSLLVLDAKYRASRANVLDAMQSAHVYRDSLLRGGQRPWGSFLLVPRTAATTWLADPVFQREFGTGAIEMADSGNLVSLKDVLKRFISEHPTQPACRR